MDETSGKRFSNPENGIEKADGKRCENIGVVLVHGIGEQRRFEHLSKEVRNLVSAITADAFANASVDVSTTRDSELFAEQQSWLAERVTPVRIHVRYNGGKTRAQSKTLHIHEVWWADLDDRSSLCNRVKFWVWALGMWGSRQFRHSRIPGASGMKVPDGVESCLLEGWVRIQLFAFAVVFALSAVTVNLLNALFRLLRLGQFTNDYFYRWVGDVKLYQDRGCPGKGPLSDLGLPRRVAIRRRMVRELVAAYRGNYDRWYVVAHSLGSVVALNGLMETAHALPNYLNRTACEDLGDDLVKSDSRTNPDDVKRMEPRRPEWITDEHQVLDRKVLFARLRGFVTYGSPLDKYACLWPQIVNVNKDNAVFRDDFEWINVFDQTDPISGNLNAYPDAFGKYNKPKNFAYKTSCVLLFSHMRYLKAKGKSQTVRFVLEAASKLDAQTVPVGSFGNTIRLFYELVRTRWRRVWWSYPPCNVGGGNRVSGRARRTTMECGQQAL